MNKIATFALDAAVRSAAAVALVGVGTYRVGKGAAIGAVKGGTEEFNKFVAEVKFGYEVGMEFRKAVMHDPLVSDDQPAPTGDR